MMRQRLHILSIAIFAGLLAGILPGIGARIAMRVVAIAAGRGTSFNLPVTLLVIVLPAATLGGIFALLYLGIRDYLPGTKRITKGIFFGALIFLLFAAPFFLVEAEFMRDIRLSPVVGRLLFFALPFLYSIPLAYIVPWLEAKWSAVEGHITRIEMARYVVSVGLLAFSLLVVAGVTSQILARSALTIGIPLRAWINGRTPDITLSMLVGAVLVLTYPTFLLLTLYLPLRRYLFGANWLRGLLLAVIIAIGAGIVAYINIDNAANTSILMRAPLTGLTVLLALLVISGVSVPMLQPASVVEGTLPAPSLSMPTKTVIIVVTLSEAVLLLASALP
jgi:hypothetical protein